MANKLILRPTYWASVSGGKDSLFMLNYILHNLHRYPYMEEQCKKAGIVFYRIKPRHTFMELYDKWGFPTRKAKL